MLFIFLISEEKSGQLRNLSFITNLTQALVSVGYQNKGSNFANNYSIQGALTSGSYTYIQIFDKLFEQFYNKRINVRRCKPYSLC